MYFLQCNSVRYKKANRSKNDIKYIVVHYTGMDGDTARNNLVNASRPGRKASAHYFVDEKEVCQSVRVQDIAWHCGTSNGYKHKECRNFNSIGVEMCSRKDKNGTYYIKKETLERSAEFVAGLMKEYNISIDHVVRHYDVTGKLCPRPLVVESEWSKFKALIISYLDKLYGKVAEPLAEIRYKTVDDVPEWARKQIKFLMDKGYLAGDGNGNIDLSHDMLRTLFICGRMDGIF